MKLDDFVARILRSGVVAREQIEAAYAQVAAADDDKPIDALARILVRDGLLTKFQAQEIAQGRGDALILGNYVLLDRIGKGGMGEVYRARHRRLEKIVALKKLPEWMHEDKSNVERFHREVRAAGRLSHPNIVAANDAGEDKGVLFLVMEYVEGETLARRVHQQRRLSLEQSVAYLRQAAQGLAYAHQQGVVHRDIKPSNLLIDHTERVKILDMGLARLDSTASAPVVEADLTQSGVVMGTVDYMSPEQALNTKRADARSDIYSLGCTWYYMLTGRAAYGGETMMERIIAHRESSLPSMRDERPDVPEAYDELFQRMIAKDPAERIASMSELLSELDRLIGTDASPRETAEPPTGATRISPLQAIATAERADSSESTDEGSLAPTILVEPQPAYARRSHASVAQQWWWALGGAGVLILAVIFWPRGDGKDSSTPDSDSVATTQTPGDEPATDRSPIVPDNPGGNRELLLDGRSSYAVVPDLSLNDDRPVTIECWVTLDDFQIFSAHPISWLGPGGVTLFYHVDHWGVSKRLSGPGLTDQERSLLIQSQSPSPTGERMHVAGVWDGEQLSLFIDGVRVPTEPFEYVLGEGTGLYIGGYSDAVVGEGDRFLAGRVDEVRVSNGVQYASDFEPRAVLLPDPSTVALYHCDETGGSLLMDASPDERHATCHNIEWVAVE